MLIVQLTYAWLLWLPLLGGGSSANANTTSIIGTFPKKIAQSYDDVFQVSKLRHYGVLACCPCALKFAISILRLLEVCSRT